MEFDGDLAMHDLLHALTSHQYLTVPAPADIIYVWEWEDEEGAKQYDAAPVMCWIIKGQLVNPSRKEGEVYLRPQLKGKSVEIRNRRIWHGIPLAVDWETGELETLPDNTVWAGPRSECPHRLVEKEG